MKSAFRSFIFLALVAFLLSACYLNDDVRTDQMGVNVDAGNPDKCMGPGVYSGDSWYDDLVEVGMGTLTFNVEDPEVATSDNQLVGVVITIQARRSSDCELLKSMLTRWPALLNDDNLKNTISATASEGIKVGVRSFNLEGLLNDRNGLADAIRTALEDDAAEYSTEIINVTVTNIALNAAYVEQLNKNAQYTAEIAGLLKQQEQIKIQGDTDRIKREQEVLVANAQLEVEKANTAIQVEIAERQGEVVAAQNQVYTDNPQAFELKRLALMAEVLGDNATVYFTNDMASLTLLLSQNGAPVVPVNTTPDNAQER